MEIGIGVQIDVEFNWFPSGVIQKTHITLLGKENKTTF